jgi:hypothetical protein
MPLRAWAVVARDLEASNGMRLALLTGTGFLILNVTWVAPDRDRFTFALLVASFAIAYWHTVYLARRP